MGKRRKGKKTISVPVYDSDDERAYKDFKRPDPNSEEYFQDEIDEFHSSRDKVLLDKGYKNDDEEMDSDAEEIYGVLSDDDLLTDDEEIKQYAKQLHKMKEITKRQKISSDIEDEEDDGLPDSRAWGKKRNKYYGGDVEDDDIELSGSDAEGAAALEEKEALALQKKMAEELDEQDFGLEIFQPKTKKDGMKDDQEKITKDLSKLTKKEKMKLLKKQSPELLTLIEDYKTKMLEVKYLLPLHNLCRDGKINEKATLYVDSKMRLNLNYCVNINFYMMLKSKQLPVHNHPVIKRLVQYRNLLKQLEPLDEKVKPEVDEILNRIKNGEELNFTEVNLDKSKFKRRKVSSVAKHLAKKKKLSELTQDSSDDEAEELDSKEITKAKKKDGVYETKDEKAALEYYKMMKGGRRTEHIESDEGDIPEEDEGEEMGEDLMEEGDMEGKRAITYQMEKNKGLTAKKKKELRNPRVKHRKKFRKALIRRRGQVREVRKELQPYGGELSGIRAAIKRGRKLK